MCKVVGASYHKRLLPSMVSANPRDRPSAGDAPASSSLAGLNASTPAPRAAPGVSTQPAAAPALAPQDGVSQPVIILLGLAMSVGLVKSPGLGKHSDNPASASNQLPQFATMVLVRPLP